MKPLDPNQYHKVVVLTGAGISVASGLPSYRGPGGLWQNEDVADYAKAETWQSDPLGVWQTFGPLRAAIGPAEPNAAHRALVEFERALPEESEFVLVTQNVDGLHQEAGSGNVVELHGNLHYTRCSNERCSLEPFRDEQTEFERLPICERCGGILRPDIVLFGEWLSVDAEEASRHALRDCDLYIAIGTSGTVTPASAFVRSADYEGARTILVNLEPMDPPNPYFGEEILGRAEEILPRLLSADAIAQ